MTFSSQAELRQHDVSKQFTVEPWEILAVSGGASEKPNHLVVIAKCEGKRSAFGSSDGCQWYAASWNNPLLRI